MKIIIGIHRSNILPHSVACVPDGRTWQVFVFLLVDQISPGISILLDNSSGVIGLGVVTTMHRNISGFD